MTLRHQALDERDLEGDRRAVAMIRLAEQGDVAMAQIMDRGGERAIMAARGGVRRQPRRMPRG
jgi:hypothetical protein